MKPEMRKRVLRQQYKEIRNTISSKKKGFVSDVIAGKVKKWNLYQVARSLLCYSAIQNEINCDKIIEMAWREKKKVCLPKVIDDSKMEVYQMNHWDDLIPGAYGILEPNPKKCKKVNPKEVDLAFIPGIAFDQKGYRLGYGGGYYDRFLQHYPQIKRIGISYHALFVPTVYPEEHDIPVDYLITEQEFLSFQHH